MKSTTRARIKREIFVNFKPEPGPNPTWKPLPDLQLCREEPPERRLLENKQCEKVVFPSKIKRARRRLL